MKRRNSLSFKELPSTSHKDKSIRAFVCETYKQTTVSETNLSSVVDQIKKSEKATELIKADKVKLPSLNKPWSNTRDVSYLKDPRDMAANNCMSLPTDIPCLLYTSDAADE